VLIDTDGTKVALLCARSEGGTARPTTRMRAILVTRMRTLTMQLELASTTDVAVHLGHDGTFAMVERECGTCVVARK
jgi:hypothetical protein